MTRLWLHQLGGEPQEPVRYLTDGFKDPGPRNRRRRNVESIEGVAERPGGADIPDLDSLHADAADRDTVTT